MPPPRASFNFSRLATISYLGSICLAVAWIANALNENQLQRGVVAAMAVLLAGFLVAGLLNAISAAMRRIDDLSRQMSETAADQTAAARSLTAKIDEVVNATRKPFPEPEDFSIEQDDAPAEAADDATSPAATEDRIVAMLDEIRGLALMSDEQRRLYLQQHLEGQKRKELEAVSVRMREGEWGLADQALTALEVQFPGDPDLKQARSELTRQRDAAEPDAFRETEQRVQDLIAVTSWKQAMETAVQFVANFPTSMPGRQLLTRVRHEYDLHRDVAFQQMYEQVQSHVDRHEWRDAMEEAQKLLDSFPTHSRSNRIRQQLQIIRENAEIEQRQEHEQRIQQLVRGRRFAEAVQVAEQVLRDYPNSPQALAVDQMLPRLRNLAEHGDETNEPIGTTA